MKRFLTLSLPLIFLPAFALAQSNLSGAWILTEQFPNDLHTHRMTLEVNGEKLTGQSGPDKIEGTVRNGVITMKWLLPDGGPNMDYNQLGEGTTIYLPVFQDGALLFMGDGHAAQGDGELTGDALETSMDFEFTVDVIPEKSIGTPRAENNEYVMAIGIGGSLDQALQHATTEMARWLENDYKLNSTESAMVLGFAVKYDVADLVGTQVSIVAKIPKTVLAQLKR